VRESSCRDGLRVRPGEISGIVLLFCIAGSLLVFPGIAGAWDLERDGIRFSTVNDPPTLEMTIRKASDGALPAHLLVRIVDTRDHEFLRREVSPDRERIRIDLPELTRLDHDQRLEFPWWRLFVEAPEEERRRIFGMADISPDAVDVRISVLDTPVGEKEFEILLETSHILNGTPLGKLDLRVEIRDDEDVLFSTAVETGPAGEIIVRIPLAVLPNHRIDIVATTDRGLFSAETTREFWSTEERVLSLASDRPIYRPEEVVHFRAVILRLHLGPVVDVPVNWELTDPDGNVVYSATTQTSAFGIASGNWLIPSGARIGDYELSAESTGRHIESVFFHVSDFQLPRMYLKVRPEKPFFLPGEVVSVDVDVKMMDGMPVSGVFVEVFSTKWGKSEDILTSTLLDASGNGKLQFDLWPDYQDLAQGDTDWTQFEDVELIARSRDVLSGEEIQTPFIIRLSHDPVHVYLRNDVGNSNRLPLNIGVATYSADGTPCACTVRMNRVRDDGKVGAEIGTITTGDYGIGFGRFRMDPPFFEDYPDVRLRADCGEGLHVERTIGLYLDSDSPFRMIPKEVLLFPHETLYLGLENSGDSSPVRFLLRKSGHTLRQWRQEIPSGIHEIAIPWEERFRGKIEIIASGEDIVASVAVLYVDPSYDSGAVLTVKPGRTRLAPGESTDIELKLSTRGGRSMGGAAGIVVTDRAVEELLGQSGDVENFIEMSLEDYRWMNLDIRVSGIGLNELNHRVNESNRSVFKPVARVLLNWWGGWRPPHRGADISECLEKAYGSSLVAMARPIRDQVSSCRWSNSVVCPESIAELQGMISRSGHDLDEMKDPWGRPLEVEMKVGGSRRYLAVSSLGPDGIRDTKDDLVALTISWNWFREGRRLRRAVEESFRETGRWPITTGEILTVLSSKHIELPKDPWGIPLRLAVRTRGTMLDIGILSVGMAETEDPAPGEEFPAVSRVEIDTFADTGRKLENLLIRRMLDGVALPQDDREVRRMAVEGGIPPERLMDLEGHELHFELLERAVFSDKEGPTPGRWIPQTEKEYKLVVRTFGNDDVPDTSDDKLVATLGDETLRLAGKLEAMETGDREFLDRLKAHSSLGGLVVMVMDSMGSLPGATVSIRPDGSREDIEDEVKEHVIITDVRGRATLALPPGIYTVTCVLSGFKTVVKKGVPIQVQELTHQRILLEPGEICEAVEVTAEMPVIDMTSTSCASTFITDGPTMPDQIEGEGPHTDRFSEAAHPLFTPRIRREAPPTLYWNPEVPFGSDGTATIELPGGDAITTWHVQAVASTENGLMTVGETRVIATLPLVADLLAPRNLTVGDRIGIPVILRNREGESVDVRVGMETLSQALIITTDPVDTTVPAEGMTEEMFPLRAADVVSDAVLRTTARSHKSGDAVEKKIRVKPLSHRWRTIRGLFVRDHGLISSGVAMGEAHPAGSRLRVYPALSIQLQHAVEGMMRRPGQCSEQLLSAGFARFLSAEIAGEDSRKDEEAASMARSILLRLESRLDPEGGLRYWEDWGKGSIALTSYALQFFVECEEHDIKIPEWAEKAASWLAGQLDEQGLIRSWRREVIGADLARTAQVALGLARYSTIDPGVEAAARRAFDAVHERLEEIDEPHALAMMVLTASALGKPDIVEEGIERLVDLAQTEGSDSYWVLRRNTPLSGWGLPGRIETTAMVVQALRLSQRDDAQRLVSTGVRFLLRHKGPFGAWYSTAASTQVLKALVGWQGSPGRSGGTMEIGSDGKSLERLNLPAGDEAAEMIEIDLDDGDVASGIELIRRGGDSPIWIDLEQEWSEDWKGPLAGQANDLRLEVDFDRTRVNRGDTIHARVVVQRLHYRGHGMLIAEIGIPPGAVVDRPGLQAQLSDSRFEILPDRVLLYFWPHAEEQIITISFHAGIPGEFRSAPSSLSDYYNPLNRIDLPPTLFVVVDHP